MKHWTNEKASALVLALKEWADDYGRLCPDTATKARTVAFAIDMLTPTHEDARQAGTFADVFDNHGNV